MEEILTIHGWQIFTTSYDTNIYHSAKVINLFKICNIFALFK